MENPSLAAERNRSFGTRSLSYLEGLESRERGKPNAAQMWFEKGAAAYPNDPSNRAGLGQLLIDVGRPAEAHEIFREVLACLDEKSPWYYYSCNYVAFAALLTRSPALMEEADELSGRAYSAVPWSGDVEGVRGCVLVALQDYSKERHSCEQRWKRMAMTLIRLYLRAIWQKH